MYVYVCVWKIGSYVLSRMRGRRVVKVNGHSPLLNALAYTIKYIEVCIVAGGINLKQLIWENGRYFGDDCEKFRRL